MSRLMGIFLCGFVVVILLATPMSPSAQAQVPASASHQEVDALPWPWGFPQEVCGYSLGGYDNAQDDAEGQAARACAPFEVHQITNQRYIGEDGFYYHCIRFTCVVGGGVATVFP